MVRVNMAEEAGKWSLVSGLKSEVVHSDLRKLCGYEHERCHNEGRRDIGLLTIDDAFEGGHSGGILGEGS